MATMASKADNASPKKKIIIIILRKCYKQFYAIKFKNIGKKGKFHETYKLVKFTQGKKR